MQRARSFPSIVLVLTLIASAGCDFLASSDVIFVELGGVVLDQANVPVPGVGVRRSGTTTSFLFSGVDGRFTVGTFAEGAYDLDVTAPAGFSAPAGSSNVSSSGREWRVRVSNTSSTSGQTVIRVQRL